MPLSPTVSIGMPIYNSARHLRAALDSMLAQTYEDFEIIVSDNASTDETQKICEQYAESDARIRYIRQSVNLGATANFRYVLLQATAEFFMWAAADDCRSPDFLAGNLAFLQRHPDYLGSTSPVRFSGGVFDAVKMGDAALDQDDANQRVVQTFSTWHANGRFYSLFRRQALVTWPHLQALEFLGSDWTLITHLASQGKLNRIDTGWVELGNQGMSHTTDIFALHRKRRLHWVWPFHTVAADAFAHLRDSSLSQRISLMTKLWRLNRKAVRKQLRARFNGKAAAQ